MLRSMSAAQHLQWQLYESIEPFPQQRADYHTAQIVQAMYNIHTRQKKEDPAHELNEFLLFNRPKRSEGPTRSWQEEMQLIKAYAAAYSKAVDKR